MIRIKEISTWIQNFILDNLDLDDNNDCFVNQHNVQNEVEYGEVEPSLQLDVTPSRRWKRRVL